MKKTLAGIIMLALVLQLSIPAFAAEGEADSTAPLPTQQAQTQPTDETAEEAPAQAETPETNPTDPATEDPEAEAPETAPEETPAEDPAEEADPADESELPTAPTEELPEQGAPAEADTPQEPEDAPAPEAQPQETPEVEPQADPQTTGNEDWNTATRLNLNAQYTGKTIDSQDYDWFVFTLTSPGRVHFTFKCDYANTSGYWTGTLYPAKEGGYQNEELLQREFSPKTTLHTTMPVGLPAGTYYYRLNPTYSIKNLGYQFTVNYTAATNWETEFNNDWPSADPVPMNTLFNASTVSGQDYDWFAFSVPAAGPLSLSFGCDYKDTGGFWTCSIYAATPGGYQKDALLERTFNPKTTAYTTLRTGLPAGDYYLRINPSSSSVADLSYHLTLNHEANAAWETEFNNDWPSANVVKLGQTAYGSSTDSSDYDWYVFTLSSTANLRIKFANEKNASGGSWVADIYPAKAGGYGSRVAQPRFMANTGATTSDNIKLKKGTYYIRLDPGFGCTDLHYSFTLNANIPLKSFKLNKTKASLVVGKTTTLEVKSYSPADTSSSKKAKWRSDNPAVATVSSKGTVKAKAAGTATITCTVAGVTKACKITVTPPTPVSKVTLKPKKATVGVGQTIVLKATVSPKKATNKNVTWKSKNKKVATVSSTGVVTGIKAGKTTITVTTKDGKKTAKCTITVQ